MVALDLAPRTRSERELLTLILNSRARASRSAPRRKTKRRCDRRSNRSQRYLFSAERRPAARRRRQRRNLLDFRRGPGVRRDCAPDRRGRGTRRAVRPDCDPGALSGTLPAAGGGRSAPRRHSGPLHARLAPARCRRAAVFSPCCIAPKSASPPSRFAEYLSLGQMPEDEEPRTPAAWERLLVDAAVIGGPDRWEMRLDGLREELHRRYREEEDEVERARLERRIVVARKSARLRTAGHRQARRASRTRDVGRVDCRTHRIWPNPPCASRTASRSCWKNSSPCPRSVRWASLKCCW